MPNKTICNPVTQEYLDKLQCQLPQARIFQHDIKQTMHTMRAWQTTIWNPIDQEYLDNLKIKLPQNRFSITKKKKTENSHHACLTICNPTSQDYFDQLNSNCQKEKFPVRKCNWQCTPCMPHKKSHWSRILKQAQNFNSL